MNEQTFWDWLKTYKNKVVLLLIITLVAGFWTVTNRRVSDVENDLEDVYSTVGPYLSPEMQAKADEWFARWDEIEPTVVALEEWLDEQADATAVTYGYQTKIHGDGPDKLVAESGGEIEVKSGGTLDLQTGSTNTFAGTVDFDGATVTNLSMSGGTILGDLTVGVDGTSYDVVFYSDTAGDFLKWDQASEALVITGTAAQDALDIIDGNVDIADDIDVDGTSNFDVVDVDDTLTVDASGAVSLDAGAASNFNTSGAGIDLTMEAEAGRLVLKGDEPLADGVYIDANDAAGTGLSIATGATAGILIEGGPVDIRTNLSDGAGDFTIADTVLITSTLTVNGAGDFDTTLNVDGASDLRGNISSTTGAVTVTDNISLDGAADVIQLTVQGNATQTSSLIVAEQSDGTDKLTLSNEGHAVLIGERDAGTGYDYFMTIEGSATGVVNGAKTYGLYVEMDRPAGYESAGGDLDDAGIKVRVETEAVTTTAGTTLRAIDAEAKADNPDGTVTNLYGGLFTAKSDTSAGDVGTMVGLSANSQNNAAVDDYLAAADLRLMRQAATEPTEEYVVEVRSSSTTGTGADAAIFINSDYGGSATTDSFDYGIDLASAAINTADIRFENGTLLSEGTDTVLSFSEFLGAAEQTAEVVTAGSVISITGTNQPISSAGAVTCSTTVCIQPGTFDGQLLILRNINASDTITIDGTGGSVECKSDVVLGPEDTLGLIWNLTDTEWNCLFSYDNS